MTDHVGQAPAVALVGRAAIGAGLEGRDRAGMDDALDAAIEGFAVERARGIHIRRIEGFRIAHPQAIVGRDMEEDVNPLQNAATAGGIAQIADHALDRQAVERPGTRAGPHQRPHGDMLPHQRPHDRRSHETGRSRDQRSRHRLLAFGGDHPSCFRHAASRFVLLRKMALPAISGKNAAAGTAADPPGLRRQRQFRYAAFRQAQETG